jgi:hypothetical protein
MKYYKFKTQSSLLHTFYLITPYDTLTEPASHSFWWDSGKPHRVGTNSLLFMKKWSQRNKKNYPYIDYCPHAYVAPNGPFLLREFQEVSALEVVLTMTSSVYKEVVAVSESCSQDKDCI